MCDRRAMAFVCLVPGPGDRPEVRILHRVMRYVELPGEDNTGFHERVLGLLGDIRPRQYPVVEVPGTTFHLIAQAVRVPTLAAMVAVIPGWNERETALLGPYTDQDPDTEPVRPRHVQLVPGRYAALLIHRHGVSPRQAFLEVSGAKFGGWGH